MAIVTRSNINAACVFEWCYRLIAVGANLFGKWDDEIVRNNFVLVYELLEGIWFLLVNCYGLVVWLGRDG